MNEKKEIPIFFATNDNYVPCLSVALASMLKNASKDFKYSIYVLTTGLKSENQEKLNSILQENASLNFVNVSEQLEKMNDMLFMRDYYSRETYYRFFIARLFPQYDKVLYLDCDIAINGDISELYNLELGENLLGAASDDVIPGIPAFVDYVEKALGVNRFKYFNAGILVINTKLFREENIEGQFVDLLKKISFTVAQDQDYLNVICQNRIKYFDNEWNKGAFKTPEFENKLPKLIHYKMNWKPWHFYQVDWKDEFWDYAQLTPFYYELKNQLLDYTDEQRNADLAAGEKLIALCLTEVVNPNNYMCMKTMENASRKVHNVFTSIADVFVNFVKAVGQIGSHLIYGR